MTYRRRYARAEGGQRAPQATPLHGGPNVTLVAALTPHGLQAAMTVSGAVNGDVFAAYLDQVLAPRCGPAMSSCLTACRPTRWPVWPK
ncbi:transposase [Hymenobacter coccineus]|uniref:transposase n=1 Tax=Hymenobacter coccineus TaxID=1908235 RepID=UPI003F6902D5